MKAVLFDRYGPPEVLRVSERPDPSPKKGEIRIAVQASSVTSGDARIRRADPFMVRFFFGLFRPKKPVPGFEFAGVVDALGEGVTNYQPGDRVFGVSGLNFGALAEYLIMKEKSTFTRMPEGWSFEEAAAIPFGAGTAKYFLQDKGAIQSSDRVLIHGASGAVGVAAVQIARIHGATVDGLCGPHHLEMIKGLGADKVIDYKSESPEAGTYDLVFDAAGKIKAAEAKPWLKPGGRFVSVQKGYAKDRAADYPVFVEWMRKGSLRPVIDEVYAMEDIAAAHRKVDSGHKTGAVVVKVISGSSEDGR